MKELLELRKKIKKKKPSFVRQDAHKKPRLEKKWRKPKGIHSKMRLKLRGYRRSVSVGYGSPKKVRGLHNSGLKSIMINSIKDIEKLDSKKECAAIAKTIGMKKRILLINKAKAVGVRIINIKNVDAYLKNLEEKFAKRKEKKKERKKKEKAKEVKKGKKEELADKIKTEEEKKEKVKKEKDKLLTKREV